MDYRLNNFFRHNGVDYKIFITGTFAHVKMVGKSMNTLGILNERPVVAKTVNLHCRKGMIK